MLVELSIENLGVIANVRLTFEPGFTVLTGETGAGKTMLVEAINLVVGKRADAAVVRDGTSEARIEARFLQMVEGREEETILSRVVGAEGRSRAYVNGRMATVTTLAEIGAELVDIHGQHAHQRLLSAANQRSALDSYAGVDLSALRKSREAITEIDAMLAALGGDEKTRAREIDLLRYQCDEIEGALIEDPDEDVALEAEEDLLADVARHREAMWTLLEHLDGEGALIDALGVAIKTAGGVRPLDEVLVRLESVAGELADIASEVRAMSDTLEENPGRLEEIRARRQLLRDLRRKYGDTLADVCDFGRTARLRLDELEGYAVRVADLMSRRETALEDLRREQLVVGGTRRSAASALGAAVEGRLRELDLPHATLSVAVGEEQGDPSGESVTFLFAANPGSAPQPLHKVASGGELARVMLALRLVLSEEPGTMVFDEVDAGIGGSAAVAVAAALRELGTRHQVFAITHLPQVAASGHHQIGVTKQVLDGRTFGTAVALEGEERIREVARMLSGGVADDSALAHARDVIEELSSKAKRRRRA